MVKVNGPSADRAAHRPMVSIRRTQVKERRSDRRLFRRTRTAGAICVRIVRNGPGIGFEGLDADGCRGIGLVTVRSTALPPASRWSRNGVISGSDNADVRTVAPRRFLARRRMVRARPSRRNVTSMPTLRRKVAARRAGPRGHAAFGQLLLFRCVPPTCSARPPRSSDAVPVHSVRVDGIDAKSWELRAAMSMARLWRDPGQGAASPRTHRRLRHARPEGGEGAAGGVSSVRPATLTSRELVHAMSIFRKTKGTG